MTLKLQQADSLLNANQKVRSVDDLAVLQINISLLLAILIIPTPSGVNLIA